MTYTLLALLTCGYLMGSCTAPIDTTPAPATAPTLAFPEAAVRTSLDTYRQGSITSRRFKQSDLQPLVDALPPSFTVDTAGRSVEQRPLWRIGYGEGPIEVLLWSQMHGDEPTATAALMDLFGWLEGQEPALDSLRLLLRQRLHLTVLPMLNPDGAQRYERRNALGIDLNRDALHLTTPEARLLKAERDRLDADWGFNLHDQGVYYGAGFPAERGCALSILAPAYDWDKSMSPKREDAAQLIALMNGYWQDSLPGQVGRYNDDFEPRAFGDNLQKWGTRTILVESGGLPGDPEKQRIRRQNLLGLITGLHGIATGAYESHSVDEYLQIPENQSNGMHEVILDNMVIEREDSSYSLSLGLRVREQTLGPDYREYTRSAYISDLGDLHTFNAFDRYDASGLRAEAGRVYPGTLTARQVDVLSTVDLLRQGYTAVRTAAPLPWHAGRQLRVLGPNERLAKEVGLGLPLDLLLYDSEDSLRAAIVNGRIIRISPEGGAAGAEK
ncbi:hypothetical protein LEM8419_01488 [Neolewinella maritima]|uniref:Peptidase M14 domain-containing protein n=1 Tax=Neolewinella maritima TaxID=1383882 RepID=A0ABN8F3H7_9BACT|nr:M14 family zinc carboxypeptidase [Neolewinella maritima]CAH1000335.1 hypothetical protein LEM8419_01488 [Neolewinella maritima]